MNVLEVDSSDSNHNIWPLSNNRIPNILAIIFYSVSKQHWIYAHSQAKITCDLFAIKDFFLRLCMYPCLCVIICMCVQMLTGDQRGWWSPWNWSHRWFWAAQGRCWEPNLGPQEQCLLLTTELPFQTQMTHLTSSSQSSRVPWIQNRVVVYCSAPLKESMQVLKWFTQRWDLVTIRNVIKKCMWDVVGHVGIGFCPVIFYCVIVAESVVHCQPWLVSPPHQKHWLTESQGIPEGWWKLQEKCPWGSSTTDSPN